MPKQRRIPTPSWERSHGTLGRQVSAHSGKFWATAGVIALVVIAIGFIAYGFGWDWYQDRQRPGSTAINVEGINYTVEDYTERARLYVADSSGQITSAQSIIPTLNSQIIDEALVLKFAEAEQGVTATDDEINAKIAEKLGITAEDPNLQARIQEQLATTTLSEDEYRNIFRAQVLRTKLEEKFTADVPATAESIQYRQIQVADQATADDTKRLIDSGEEDFVVLAAARSMDTASKDTGGDQGWAPRGYLSEAVEDTLFGLEEGGTTTYPTSSSVFVFQVVDKDPDREIDGDKRTAMGNQALNEWLQEKRDASSIRNDLDTDADKVRYVINHANLTLQ